MFFVFPLLSLSATQNYVTFKLKDISHFFSCIVSNFSPVSERLLSICILKQYSLMLIIALERGLEQFL